ncbi:aspartate/glutamate racemase family protein [Spongiimicrobium salis]|uniref:aspartate/glutamate racemase family protein n=1 Tax=Spongiimicrobium salis TaxID=1667022 RepID=UPI00374C8BB6
MKPIDEKTIGILGGMGPKAGIALYDSITSQTKANRDQDHLSVILMSFPKEMIDRTQYLENENLDNPAFKIAESIKKLELAGAEIIGIACNTSHCPKIYNEILRQLQLRKFNAKLLNMPTETCKFIKSKCAKSTKVGIMATNGTIRSGLYQDLLIENGYTPVVPEIEFQKKVIHRLIYDKEFGIKSKPNRISKEVLLLWNQAIQFFKSRNTDIVILGCTELSLLLKEYEEKHIMLVDSTSIMASALIREARVKEKLLSTAER